MKAFTQGVKDFTAQQLMFGVISRYTTTVVVTLVLAGFGIQGLFTNFPVFLDKIELFVLNHPIGSLIVIIVSLLFVARKYK